MCWTLVEEDDTVAELLISWQQNVFRDQMDHPVAGEGRGGRGEWGEAGLTKDSRVY